jgi:hypothetical protein
MRPDGDFPKLSEINLTLAPPPVAPAAIDAETLQLPREQSVIPLPPSAHSGAAGLAVLAVGACRKRLWRFVR